MSVAKLPAIAHSVDVQFQPIVNIHTGMCLGIESILPEPCRSLDRAFETALEQFSNIRIGQIGLFYRIDAAAMTSDFLKMAQNAVLSAGLTPSLISIQISELHSTLSNAQTAYQLKKLGFEVGLDDFGSGCSRVGALYELQPDFIKLGRSLTAGHRSRRAKAPVCIASD